MKIIFLLLIYLNGNADCIYHTVQNSHNYFKNIRFGVFEDQRRTADILKEELIITLQLREIQEWFTNKGIIYCLHFVVKPPLLIVTTDVHSMHRNQFYFI